MTRAVLSAVAVVLLLAGCASHGTASASKSASRAVSRKGTCDIEVAALVDLDIAAARTAGDKGTTSLVPVLGAHNPVLVAAETVSAALFKQGTTSGATKAISQQCATRHDPVLNATDLAAVRRAVPAADVAVLKHITITH